MAIELLAADFYPRVPHGSRSPQGARGRLRSFGWNRLLVGAIPATQLVAVLIGLLIVSAATPPAAGRVLVEAHRGNSAHAPENTVASIQAAVPTADLTEFDVRVTSDGELVLMHDGTVDRTTNGSGAVSSMSLADIQTLDAGSWFSPAFAGERVPTMAEAVDAALLGGITPLIERKAGSAQLFHDEFVSLGLSPHEFRLISFDWSFLSGLDALNPEYNLGALGSGVLDQAVINAAIGNGADFLDWSHAGINQAAVDLAHANNLELHVWTVDSSSRMQQLIDLGVDGITTNSPAVLLPMAIRADPSADLNFDELVDRQDWLLYHAGRGVDLSHLSVLAAFQRGDLDGDLDNDIADFVTFRMLYEAANGPGSFAALVPEPATLPLLICAAGSLILMVTKGRRR